MKENKNEEIQARRGFFKSASKGAMPVMTLQDVATTVSAKLLGGSCQTACFQACANGCTWQAPCKYGCYGGNKVS